jgi:hypothetical protein
MQSLRWFCKASREVDSGGKRGKIPEDVGVNPNLFFLALVMVAINSRSWASMVAEAWSERRKLGPVTVLAASNIRRAVSTMFMHYRTILLTHKA